MSDIIISKGPKRITVEGCTFFEARSFMGVFLGAFGDENAAWGVSTEAQIKLVIESLFNKKNAEQKERWFKATLSTLDGKKIERYAALVSGAWSEAFETTEDLSVALGEPNSSTGTPQPKR